MSAKIGRNERCPCGSGRRYKHCHGGSTPPAPPTAFVPPIPPHRILDAFVDEQRKNIVFVGNDFLFKSLQRDCPKIAADFDRDFLPEMRVLNDQFSQAMDLVIRAMTLDEAIEAPELRTALVFLVMNACQSFVAALDLLRHGYRLQPGVLLRALVEQLTTVCHLIQKPADLEALRKGTLDPTKTVAAAKKILPIFGRVYGLFSNSFAHVSHHHFALSPVVSYSRTDSGLLANLRFLRAAIWLLYVVSEVTFFSHVQQPRYWKTLGGGAFEFSPDKSERDWMDRFLSEDLVGHKAGSEDDQMNASALAET